MASILTRMPSPPLMVVNGRKPISGTPQRFAFPTARVERLHRFGVIAKATGESSESSIGKSIQDIWENSEDRVALIGLGFAGVVGFWAAVNIVTAIDKLPVVPSLLELIGLLFASWFTYRYLLFKPDRQELSQKVSKSISDILGQ
ncbi:protein CURVATURE THYLAKOID 1C, chloroplastic isoform X1 [Salvia hispanica]|uniref:protein CURVATURE THYLAKOID 1C, chloroplastic-like isoform X1 n=1 Tax=Salvia splendens TaxID=180675 RepID=UPI001C251E6E|nr:protein CURVATURE THYLAKOID 1C, chloroplastic-like isoform X1 [Salvia splendens]XP_042043820.1 protein CURVATURE THYLAKOID 1C, chloroplastic-like isoform X1 [Salvia splendens]XP_047939221.1 protein CURVATURE THYLAKOID 1C, chloroplastic isoform X1 [Salvia hispanica]